MDQILKYIHDIDQLYLNGLMYFLSAIKYFLDPEVIIFLEANTSLIPFKIITLIYKRVYTFFHKVYLMTNVGHFK